MEKLTPKFEHYMSLIPINLERMDDELTRHAEHLTEVVREWARAECNLMKAKAYREETEGKLHAELKASGVGSDKVVEAMRDSDKAVLDTKLSEADYKEAQIFFAGMMKAFDHRHTMMVNLNKRLMQLEGVEH